jgi:1-deoxy-D-xylulose-5-phosphate reductoisomerase
MGTVRASGAMLLPIDSEHNAIFQCLPPFASGELAAKGIRRILLTGSGGPFRGRARAELHRVTPEEACAHPNWVMGRKISVDSATMMNKGLEIIEAHWLFGASPEQIQVVVHPQSVVHRMGTLAVERPDFERVPALGLAYGALRTGGEAPAALNAANEVAVAAFLEGRLPFLNITTVIEETLAGVSARPLSTLEDVLAADAGARARAKQIVSRLNSNAA